MRARRWERENVLVTRGELTRWDRIVESGFERVELRFGRIWLETPSARLAGRMTRQPEKRLVSTRLC